MKRIILVVLLCFVSGIGWCVVNQPQTLGDVKVNKLNMGPFTLAQINSLTPDDTGQMVLCSNCTQSSVCISSGADSGRVGAFVILVETGTFVGATYSGFRHCQ